MVYDKFLTSSLFNSDFVDFMEDDEEITDDEEADLGEEEKSDDDDGDGDGDDEDWEEKDEDEDIE